jgi:predicted outer membrane repeat protein
MSLPLALRRLAICLSFLGLTAMIAATTARPALAAGGTVGTGSPGSCTEATFDNVFYASQSSGGGVITFNCGAAAHTIIFTGQKAVSANTELRGAGLITLSGGNATSLFQVYSGQKLTLTRMTLTRGYGPSGAIENFGQLTVNNSQLTNNTSTGSGGAITSYGQLSVTNSTISGNSAGDTGGGIFADGGAATITGSKFADNTAFAAGGAIRGTIAATVTIDNGQFTGNKATDTFAQGGALRAEGAVTVKESAFSGNYASRGGALSVGDGLTKISRTSMTGNWSAYGGAIRQEGGEMTLTDVTLGRNGYGSGGQKVTTGGGGISWGNGKATLTNVTLSGNWASYGGGFDHSGGTTTLTNVTISGNSAVGSGGFDTDAGTIALTNVTITGNSALFNGGGIGNRGGTITAKNTLVAGNFKTDNGQKWNCYATLAGSSFSLSSDNTCSLGSGRDNASLPLGPLANNGGYTQTHLLRKGSAAVDAGTGVGCPATDQRGISRPQGAACDVGGVEMRAVDFQVKTYLSAALR